MSKYLLRLGPPSGACLGQSLGGHEHGVGYGLDAKTGHNFLINF